MVRSMYASEKPLIFLCASAIKAGNKKLSYRIASQLAFMGFGEIGTLEDLSHQHSTEPEAQRKMIFINNCKSGCMKVLTHGFDEKNYIFLDVSPFLSVTDFSIGHYINTEILPRLTEKWDAIIS